VLRSVPIYRLNVTSAIIPTAAVEWCSAEKRVRRGGQGEPAKACGPR